MTRAQIRSATGIRLTRNSFLVATACAAMGLLAPMAIAQPKPIRIGMPTAMQLQVGRDTQDAAKMAIEDINAKGGVLGEKLKLEIGDDDGGASLHQLGDILRHQRDALFALGALGQNGNTHEFRR